MLIHGPSNRPRSAGSGLPGCSVLPGSVRRVVGLEHVGRNATPLRDLHPLLLRPFPNGLVLLAVGRWPGGVRSAARGPATAGARTPSGGNERGEGVTQPRAIGSRQ